MKENNKPMRNLLVELGYEDSIVFENPDYDNAIIGTDDNGRVIYDYELMAECLMEEDGMSYEEAIDFIEFNTIRAIPYMGENSPIILHNFTDYADYICNSEFKFEVKEVTEKLINWIRNWFEENGNGCNAVIGMSGGKDSTIVAALCAKALGKERVIGVAMPDDGQGTNGAEEICNYLGIRLKTVNIGNVCNDLEKALGYGIIPGCNLNTQSKQNIPPRVRMTVLYAIAQNENGRVANTCNLSEDYIGYSTLFGDCAGSFAPISKLTVTEVKEIGKELGLPDEWVDKVPDDGLPNSCPDEEKLGFTYKELDDLIRFNTFSENYDKIQKMHYKNLFKMNIVNIPSFNPKE